MKQIIFIFFFLLAENNFCQTNFSIGFSDGYKVGYCFDQGTGCISPIPPSTPLCTIGESSDSYFDGYNRGLIVGASDKTSNRNNSNTEYRQSTSIVQIERFKPDYSFYERALKQIQSNYEKKINSKTQSEKEVDEEIDKKFNEYMSAENVARREQYVKFLHQYYLDLKEYPSSIPDGIYKVTVTAEPQVGNIKLKTDFYEAEAIVEDNKVILLKHFSSFTGEDSYSFSINKFPDVINKKDVAVSGITDSYSILNGKGEIRVTTFFSGKALSSSEINKIYFIDYITEYQNAQKCIQEVKTKYYNLKKYPIIQDGWNIVYANDGEGFCDIRKVFVEKGKVTKYKSGDGTDFSITSGGNVLENKTTISYTHSIRNDGSNSKTYIIEIYFF